MPSDEERKAGADPQPAGLLNTTQSTAHTIRLGSAHELEMSMQQQLQKMQNSMEQFMKQMMDQQQLMQQQVQQQVQQQQQERLSAHRRLNYAHGEEPSHTAHSTADTLPTPASAIKPTVRGTGRSMAPAVESLDVARAPHTPRSAVGEPDASDRHEYEGLAPRKPALKDILSMMRGFVEPFYADSVKDKGTTVVDFVVKVESAMSDVIDGQQQYELAVVRLFTRDGALRWINRHMDELAATGLQAIDWRRDVRRAFIEAHLGTDTAELWLAKLGTLRLGKGKTATPIELDNQFDTIARHLYPSLTAGDKGADLLLTTQYRDIIAASNRDMFKTIVRTQPHATLKEWKTAVAIQWNAEAQIRAMESAEAAVRASHKPRGGGQARHYDRPAGARVAAAQAEDGAGQEGQVSGDDSDTSGPAPQLSAAAGSARGGRGGRGGRVRGGAAATERQRTPMTAEQRQRFIDGLCLACGDAGHIARNCPKAEGEQ